MSDSKQPPRLPDVVDEAGDTPRWVPLLGLGLLCALALFLALRHALDQGQSGKTPAAVTQDAGVPPAK